MGNKTKQVWDSALEAISKLENLLQDGHNLGVDIDKKLSEKIVALKQDAVAGRKLRIALVGGFSEGKTSIAAAWLGKLDKTTMKIREEESSDEISIYNTDNDIEIVDTPGLFGFKEKDNGEKFKEITRQWISRADIVLYVMNPNNPIKDTHKEELEWLFRTLNLLLRTVFVLSQFDREADIEDEVDYRERLAIKTENVKGRLSDFLNLSQKEMDSLTVVAVSANPHGKGFEYWIERREDYNKLSHIPTLQQATAEKIVREGGAVAIIKETEKSIMKDITTKTLPVAEQKFSEISTECEKMENMSAVFTKELDSLDKTIRDSRKKLREVVMGYFSDLILQVKGLSQDSYVDFFEREIGSNGIIVSGKIKGFFEDYVDSTNLKIKRQVEIYNAETSHFRDLFNKYGGQELIRKAGDFVRGIDGNMVLQARDMLGLSIKFKPWGAINLAGQISTLGGAILSGLGLVYQAWQTYDAHKKEQAFNEAMAKMVLNFEGQREELVEKIIDSDEFIERFFSDYIKLAEQVKNTREKLFQIEEDCRKFEIWKKDCEIIDAEIIA